MCNLERRKKCNLHDQKCHVLFRDRWLLQHVCSANSLASKTNISAPCWLCLTALGNTFNACYNSILVKPRQSDQDQPGTATFHWLSADDTSDRWVSDLNKILGPSSKKISQTRSRCSMGSVYAYRVRNHWLQYIVGSTPSSSMWPANLGICMKHQIFWSQTDRICHRCHKAGCLQFECGVW